MYKCYSCEWMFILYIIPLFKKHSWRNIYSVLGTVLIGEEEIKESWHSVHQDLAVWQEEKEMSVRSLKGQNEWNTRMHKSSKWVRMVWFGEVRKLQTILEQMNGYGALARLCLGDAHGEWADKTWKMRCSFVDYFINLIDIYWGRISR